VVRLRRDPVSGLSAGFANAYLLLSVPQLGFAMRGASSASAGSRPEDWSNTTPGPTRSASRRRCHQSFGRCRYPMAVLCRAASTGCRRPAHLLRPVEPLVPARDPAMLAVDDLQPIFDSCATRAKYDCIFSHAS
jgi:hypothetical protein